MARKSTTMEPKSRENRRKWSHRGTFGRHLGTCWPPCWPSGESRVPCGSPGQLGGARGVAPGALLVVPGGLSGGPCPPVGATLAPEGLQNGASRRKKAPGRGRRGADVRISSVRTHSPKRGTRSPKESEGRLLAIPGAPGAAVSVRRGAQEPLGASTLAPKTPKRRFETASRGLSVGWMYVFPR